jgi:photosystem II stability/assembly factor-like uncharacterized protein
LNRAADARLLETPKDMRLITASLFTARACRALCLGLALAGPLATPQAQAGDASQAWSIPSDRASRGLMLDATRAGQRLIAVGDRGHILLSDDEGQHWIQAPVPTRQLLTAVFFVDERHGWAVGHDAQILASDDAGSTWTLQHQDLQREAPLLDVWFQDTRKGFAVGAYGALLATLDGGQHWLDVSARLDNDEQLHLNALGAVKDAGLFIVGEQGRMFRSADDGQTWTAVQSPYSGSLFGLIGTSQSQTLLVFGLRGSVLRSTDFGSHWQRIEVPDSGAPLLAGLAGAARLANGSLVLVGNAGKVLRSDDHGQTFSVGTRPDRLALSAVVEAGSGGWLLVGQAGLNLAGPTVVEPGATSFHP